MTTSLDNQALAGYVAKQVNHLFPDGNDLPVSLLEKHMARTMERVEYCFSKVNNKYFFDGRQSVFSHLHGDQFAMFLYYLSNTLYRAGEDTKQCSKLFLLNKALHGVDAFYEVSLPDIFMLVHPLATVLGRGEYNDYLLVYQRCGIGSNHDVYPKLGKYLTMHPGAAILGKCSVGNYCTMAAESLLLDKDLSDSSIYIGKPGSAITRPRESISNFWRK